MKTRTNYNKPIIQKPDCWDKYESPIDNLLYAILLQGVTDSLGYWNTFRNCHDTGDSARDWVLTEGKQIFEYLKTRPKKSVSCHTNSSRKHRNWLGKISFEQICDIYKKRFESEVNKNDNN